MQFNRPRIIRKGPKRPDAVTPAKRPSSKPIDETAKQAFSQVQPPGFKDRPNSSMESALSDPDVEDSEGGE